MIKVGQKGSEVAAVQMALNKVSPQQPKLKPDGIFGPATLERVKQHQQKKSLQVDGVVGPATFETLFHTVTVDFGATFTRKPAAAAGSVSSFRPGLRGPAIPVPRLHLDPEFMPFSREFLDWWNAPTPKPALPNIPAVLIPTIWGPMMLPTAPQRVMIEPSAMPSTVLFETPAEGKAWSVEIAAEKQFDPAKRSWKNVEYKGSVTWLMLKRPLVELGLQGSFIRNDEGDLVGEVEAKVTTGDMTPLKKKIGKDFLLKIAPYAAVAVSSEIAATAKLGTKAAAEYSPFNNFTVGIATELFSKVTIEKKKTADGREKHVIKGGSGLMLGLSAQYAF